MSRVLIFLPKSARRFVERRAERHVGAARHLPLLVSEHHVDCPQYRLTMLCRLHPSGQPAAERAVAVWLAHPVLRTHEASKKDEVVTVVCPKTVPADGALKVERQANVGIVGTGWRRRPRRLFVELEAACSADHVDRSIADRARNGSLAARAAHSTAFAYLPDRRTEPPCWRPK